MNRKFLAGLLGVCFVLTIALPSMAAVKMQKLTPWGAVEQKATMGGNVCTEIKDANGKVTGCTKCSMCGCRVDEENNRCVCSHFC